MGERTGRPRGRPPGAKNKRSAERQQAIAAKAAAIEATIGEPFQGDAHDLLMAVYKDPNHDWDLRIDAAKAAIGYEKPKLASVEASGPDGGPLVVEVMRFGEGEAAE